MTYYFKIKGTLARKEGGEPPTVDEYVAVGKDNVVRYFKNGQIVDKTEIAFPIDADTSTEISLFKDLMGKKLAKDMLYPQFRKKKTSKPKPKRKTKKRGRKSQ